jgi:hypothetical protein
METIYHGKNADIFWNHYRDGIGINAESGLRLDPKSFKKQCRETN